MSCQQSFSLRWSDHSSYIAGAFESLRHEEDLVDVTLYCEGRKIRAHKMLLSACSTYFRDIFKENPCQHPIVIFENVKYVDLVSLVEFIYQGEVHVMQESLPSFLHTADMLAIRGLCDTPMDDQPTSSLAQQILETQSRNINSATITTDPVYYAVPSATSATSQQRTMEPETSVPELFINNTLLKSDNTHATSSVDISIVTHVPQQQHPSSVLQIPVSSNENVSISTNTDGMTTAKELTARVFSLSDSILATSKQEAHCNAISNNEMETHDKTASQNEDVKINFPEFISVSKILTTDSDTSGKIRPGLKMMCEAISNRSESLQTSEQSNSFDMQIAMDDLFSDEDGAPGEAVVEGAVKRREKKHKCTMCCKSFVTWKSLTMHSQIHAGRTQCSICGAVLSRTANLKRHMKLKHEP